MIDKVVYTFSPKNAPAERVTSGSTVILRTMDCFSNQIKSSDQLVTSIDFNHVNPASGPVFVENAMPGDVLKVEILDIIVDPSGTTTTLPDNGPLFDTVETRTKIIQIKENIAYFNDISFPIDPMIGVIGVAPADKEVPCGYPGNHGGNMDNHLIKKGATLYFPIQVEGGLFQCGDIHATMGDCELCGTGIEIAGIITVKLTVIKQFKLNWPLLETADKWFSIASAPDYNAALKNVSLEMQDLICRTYGWDKTDAYLYMSIQGDVEICQACQPCVVDMILRLGIPKQAERPLIKD
jgi:amidase